MKTESEKKGLQDIVFFDGVCGLCNSFINRLLASRGDFLFAPLQGEVAKKILDDKDRTELASIVFLQHGVVYRQSEAVLRILAHIGGIYSLFSLFVIVPRPLRDFFYNTVGRNRYRIFGKKESCRIPTPEERARFLP